MKTEGNSIFSENNAGKQCVMVLTYMSRATDSERAQRVNSAFDLLVRGHSLSEAAQVLTESFALSRRQAYRYPQEAQELA